VASEWLGFRLPLWVNFNVRKSLIGCSYWATTYRSLDPRPNPYGFGCILFQVPSIKDVASNYGRI